ncbi:MAG: amino acid permease [Acidobacteriota bacterium]
MVEEERLGDRKTRSGAREREVGRRQHWGEGAAEPSPSQTDESTAPDHRGGDVSPAVRVPLREAGRLKRLIFGRPRDLSDTHLFERLSLVALLAWVGLGADGLSSSSYGPEEAFRTLGQHTYLAVGIAALMALTVGVIAAAYSRIIGEFPHGGGGYVVASKLLGAPLGVVSGCALLVDYVLTIAVSIAASCDALFSLLPGGWAGLKLEVGLVLIAALTILNIRGVKESVVILTPIFALFLVTHVVLIAGCTVLRMGEIPAVAAGVRQGFASGLQSLGLGGMLVLLAHAYSLGGGTYTGIEAVSNGLPIMR